MKNPFHFLWMLCSFAADAGRDFPEGPPLNQDTSVLEKTLPSKKEEGSSKKTNIENRLKTEEASGKKDAALGELAVVHKQKGDFFSQISPEKFVQIVSRLDLKSLRNLALTNSVLRQKVSAFHVQSLSSQKAGKNGAAGAADAAAAIKNQSASLLTLNKHLFSEIISYLTPKDMVRLASTSVDFNRKIGALPSKGNLVEDLKKRCAEGKIDCFVKPMLSEGYLYYPRDDSCNFLEKIFDPQKTSVLLDSISKAFPLILRLSEEMCKKLTTLFPDWKKTIKEKNIPIVVHNWRLLKDPYLAPQIIRLFIDMLEIDDEECPEILEAVNDYDGQISIDWNAKCLSFTNHKIEALEVMAEAGKISEIVCGGPRFRFDSPYWDRLIYVAEKIRSFECLIYSDYTQKDLSFISLVNDLSKAMPYLKRLCLMPYSGGWSYEYSGRMVVFNHLQEVMLAGAKMGGHSFLTVLPKHLKYLFIDERIDVRQALIGLIHFNDLYCFMGGGIHDENCTELNFLDAMDNLGKHKNLKGIGITVGSEENLEILVERIPLFQSVQEFSLIMKLPKLLTAAFAFGLTEALFEALSERPALQSVLFYFEADLVFQKFILQALSMLPRRVTIGLRNDDLPEIKANVLKSLQQIAQKNPTALTRIKISNFLDLKSCFKEKKIEI
jgi:hypothetical protein